jgi:hypothetical protein
MFRHSTKVMSAASARYVRQIRADQIKAKWVQNAFIFRHEIFAPLLPSTPSWIEAKWLVGQAGGHMLAISTNYTVFSTSQNIGQRLQAQLDGSHRHDGLPASELTTPQSQTMTILKADRLLPEFSTGKVICITTLQKPREGN